MTRHSIPIAALTLAATLIAPVHAQPRVFATGLARAAKLILGPSGSLLVSDFSETANSGRVSVITSNGTRQTLIDGLPSGTGGTGPDGPIGLVLEGNTLYVAIGEGDQIQAGATAGTFVPNAKGPASPILASILQIDFAGPVDKILTPFSLKVADHTVLANGLAVALDNGAGGKATVSKLTDFRYRPDPVSVYRNTHPYALAKFPGDDKHLYLADAGLNMLVQVDLPGGRSRTLTAFPAQPNISGSGPPTAEAVPDGLQIFGNRLLVTLLTGFPFGTGNSKVLQVDPVTGDTTVVLENLTSAIDVAWRTRFFGALDYYVLEHSTNLRMGAPGRLRLINAGGSTVVADNLTGPTAMALDVVGSKLYIATLTGNILQLDLPN